MLCDRPEIVLDLVPLIAGHHVGLKSVLLFLRVPSSADLEINGRPFVRWRSAQECVRRDRAGISTKQFQLPDHLVNCGLDGMIPEF